MTQELFWTLVVIFTGLTCATAMGSFAYALISNPLQRIRESVQEAVGQTAALREELRSEAAAIRADLGKETAAIRSDLAQIERHARNHDETLRVIQGGQDVIVASLDGILPSDRQKIVETSVKRDNVISIYKAMER